MLQRLPDNVPVLPTEALRLVRLFLSLNRKSDRDDVVEMVEKYIKTLKEEE